MRILYISNSIIPSRTANSIHVMKMCQAFADNGHQVTLLAPDNKNKYEKGVKNIFDYYGVRENFKIKKLWYPNLKSGAIFYTLLIIKYLLFNKKFDLVLEDFYMAVISRHYLEIKQFLSHMHPFMKRFGLLIKFNLLIKSKYFKVNRNFSGIKRYVLEKYDFK